MPILVLGFMTADLLIATSAVVARGSYRQRSAGV